MQFLNPNAKGTAIIYREQCFSYAELREAVAAMAYKVMSLTGNVLCLTAQNNPDFIIQLLAALYNNQTVAIFSSMESQADIQYKRSLLGNAVLLDEQGRVVWKNKGKQRQHPLARLILFTSGTTGKPKAVQLSEKNIISNCHAIIDALDFSSVQDQLLFLPLSYSFGLLGQLLPALLTDLTTLLLDNFTEVLGVFESGKMPQMLSGVPSHWYAVNRISTYFPDASRRVTCVVSAGAPLHLQLRGELKANFVNATIYNNYGLTEASPRVLTLSSEDPAFMSDAVGYPVGDWQVALSEDRELLLSGSQVMLGYLGEENNPMIKNGWLYTADLAEIDNSGLVYIRGRVDDMVNIAGVKVHLLEIENKLKTLLKVRQLAIIPVEDPLYGIVLAAMVEDNSDGRKIEENFKEIQDAAVLSVNPKWLWVMPSLPQNSNGKIDREQLRRLAKDIFLER